MKILHVCLGNYFIDGQSYQENLLSKFHKELGYEVEIVASLVKLDQSGSPTFYEKVGRYINEYSIPVTRLAYKKPIKIYEVLRRFIGFDEFLKNSKPDIIFVHGCQFLDIDIIVNYAKKNRVKIYVDNHADFSNSATNWLSKTIKHGVIWKSCAKKIEPFTTKFYGVLPARVDFLKEVYGITEDKCDLLVMGADDELVKSVKEKKLIEGLRNKLGIEEKDFMIITGGKINRYRPETINLMQAVSNIKDLPVKLVIFGTVTDDLRQSFEQLCENGNIIYVGWIDSRETYQYMAAAELVVFPGLHSVMWEQAVAIGKPCVFRDIKGVHHVDLGGNAIFMKDVSEKMLEKIVRKIYSDKNLYDSMLKCATEKGSEIFSYRHIAEISVK